MEEKAPETTKENKLEEKKAPRVSTKELAIRLGIKIAAIVFCVWIAVTFVFGVNIHYGNNMHPALNDGDLVVSLRLQKPYINAAVLYKWEGKQCVGRVVALPGNKVDITENGELTINGVIASEDIYYPTQKAEQSSITYPYTVEEGKAFLLNDNRTDANDSRTFGAVDLNAIEGPIIFSFRRRGF